MIKKTVSLALRVDDGTVNFRNFSRWFCTHSYTEILRKAFIHINNTLYKFKIRKTQAFPDRKMTTFHALSTGWKLMNDLCCYTKRRFLCGLFYNTITRSWTSERQSEDLSMAKVSSLEHDASKTLFSKF